MRSFKTNDEWTIFQAVEEWIEALAEQRYSDAFQMFYVPAESHWSQELLQAVAENYGAAERRPDGRLFSVTSPREAQIADLSPRWEIDWYDEEQDGEIAEVIADLPLNGTWSDLTALLVLKRSADEYFLQLVRVDVL